MKRAAQVRIYFEHGAMRKTACSLSHKRSAEKGTKKLNIAFAPLEKL